MLGSLKEHKLFIYVLLFNFISRSILAAAVPLSGDEAYFWEWSRHLALGYYSHPPITGWLIALITTILPAEAYIVRLTGIILHLLTVMGVYWIALDISNKKGFSVFVHLFIHSCQPL